MLDRLLIENIALIDCLDLNIPSGFIAITGETGAGKSILLDALGLLLGERADRELIQTQKEKAVVQAVFSTNNQNKQIKLMMLDKGIEFDEREIILSRELSISGRNACRVNGYLSSVSILKSISNEMIEIIGQHEHQNLLYVARHIEYLDDYSGKNLMVLKKEYQSQYEQWLNLKKHLHKDIQSDSERARQKDILNFQINDIQQANLQSNEEELLQQEKNIMANQEHVEKSISEANIAFYGNEETSGIVSLFRLAEQKIGEISYIGDEFKQIHEKIRNMYFDLDDISREVNELLTNTSFDAQRYEEIGQRLDLIYQLKRKYGNSIIEIIKYLKNSQQSLLELENKEELAKSGEKQLKELEQKCYHTALKLHQIRINTAANLKNAMLEQLNDLEMNKANFEIRFSPIPPLSKDISFKSNGLDTVEFLLSANAGEVLKPLQKVASGGELSRIMLALKSLETNKEHGQTLIFDEIDAGISGKAAGMVGKKMKKIAQKGHQLICVTHSPQIAAMANHHFHVTKFEENGQTRSQIYYLDYDQRVSEIARIMSSSTQVTEEAIAHARNLLKDT